MTTLPRARDRGEPRRGRHAASAASASRDGRNVLQMQRMTTNNDASKSTEVRAARCAAAFSALLRWIFPSRCASRSRRRVPATTRPIAASPGSSHRDAPRRCAGYGQQGRRRSGVLEQRGGAPAARRSARSRRSMRMRRCTRCARSRAKSTAMGSRHRPAHGVFRGIDPKVGALTKFTVVQPYDTR